MASQCAPCHNDSYGKEAIGNYIPFDNFTKLKNALSHPTPSYQSNLMEQIIERTDPQGPYTPAREGGGLMPYGRARLSPEQHQKLIQFLEQLRSSE